uniref:EF-hand domain-containing protein n=1 Tax=Panagrolaimus sp. ES5 TaxID=591445 RepID=A0AC34FLX9_9BILA
MTDNRPQTLLENLSELFHTIDSNGNELVTPSELEGFLTSDKSRRLSLRQHKTLFKTIQKMSPNELMDVEGFETVLTSPSTYDTLWKKTMVIIGDWTTPTSRKLEVRTYLDAHTCCPPAIFLILISIFQIFMFLKFNTSEKVNSMLHFSGPLRYPEIYRYITYIFVHDNVTHLTGNVIIQLFCIPCEIVDHWRVWIIYIVGAIFGSSTYYIVCPKGELIGASAAVFALLAINIAELIMNWHEMPLRLFRLTFYGSYILCHFIMVVWSFTHTDGFRAIVSECAHVGGFLSGILLGLILVKNLKIEQHEIVIRFFCMLLFTLVCGALFGLNVYNLYKI